MTEDGLVWATKNQNVELTEEKKKQLMGAYLSLAAFPDVKPGLEELKKQGVKLAILSNGEPKMLEAAAKSAGIRELLDDIISVEEVKTFKTSWRVYNLAPERMKVRNSELGFVLRITGTLLPPRRRGSTRSGSNGALLKCRRNSVSRPTQPSRRLPTWLRFCAVRPRCP